MRNTNHANERMAQRNINQATIDRAVKLAQQYKARHVAVFVQRENAYIAIDTKDGEVITAMRMHQHRIKRHGTALRAAKAHAQHYNTQLVAI